MSVSSRDAQEVGHRDEGIEASADYIAASFRIRPQAASGLDDYFQSFTIRAIRADSARDAGLQGPGGTEIKPEKSTFQALAIGSGGKFDGVPIVFAGYGISAKDDSKTSTTTTTRGSTSRESGPDHSAASPSSTTRRALRRQDDDRFRDLRPQGDQRFQHGAVAILLVNDLAGLKGARTR